MKVLLINGSPKKSGNTFIALSEVASALKAADIETEIVSIGTKAVQGCIACNKCKELGDVYSKMKLYNSIRAKLGEADGIVTDLQPTMPALTVLYAPY